MESVSTEPLGSGLFCSECGRSFPAEDLARFGASAVCADCKPRLVQRMREGASAAGGVVYGGFWRRLVAILLDFIILTIVMFPIQMMVGAFVRTSLARPTPGMVMSSLGILWLISLAVNLTYFTFFVSQKGATPGKMVMGMRVVTATGGRVSVGRAVGRYFAQLLSGFILCIGYIMAAFDFQKRALHDYICSTRVIRQA